MRPFGPLAALCLLFHLFQLVHIVHTCKEIKLKFDLQRMVESEFLCLSCFFTQFLLSGTAKKICAGTPRITRGMGTNITLEPGERVSLGFGGKICFCLVAPTAWQLFTH